jgi:hypothetical protein
MTKYYRDCETKKKKYALDEKIMGGVILTHFDKESGVRFGNSNYKFFVSTEDLKKYFEPFEFEIAIGKKEQGVLRGFLQDVLYELKNHGIEEDSISSLEAVDRDLCIVKRISEGEKIDIEKELSRDDLFEWQDADAAIHVLEAMAKIAKKAFTLLRKKK